MSTSVSSLLDDHADGQHPEFDPNLCVLLDHLATELATEYIRLMEANAEPAAVTST